MQREPDANADAYSVAYDPDTDAVEFVWERTVERPVFRRGSTDLLEFAESVGASGLVVDTREFPEHSTVDRRWLAEAWIPRLAETEIERVAVVHSGSTLQTMDAEALEEATSHLPGETLLTDSVAEGREWVRDG